MNSKHRQKTRDMTQEGDQFKYLNRREVHADYRMKGGPNETQQS
jgi:hypothetical protein